MLTTIAIIMAIYMIAMVAISWMGKKYANSFEDYVSAGKSCGIIMMIGGAMGAHIGNGLVVGGAGEGAGVGFSGIAYGIGCCISYLILPFVMNHFVYSNGYLSMGEYLSKRYHNFLPAQIFTWATVFSFIGLVGGQLMAGGALFEALGMSKILGVVIIAMVVFLYSQISGLWGHLQHQSCRRLLFWLAWGLPVFICSSMVQSLRFVPLWKLVRCPQRL